MNRITFCESVDIDGEGFRQRLQGRGIRDCILILTPEGGPSFGLLHKEPSSSTFVEEEIRGNKGALNIDSSRIATQDSLDGGDTKITNNDRTVGWDRPWRHDEEAKRNAVQRQKDNVAKAEKMGRFPANLVLVHDSKCEKVGSKRVKPSNGSGTAHQDKKVIANKVYQGEWDPHGVSGKAGYASEDGTETVDNWECVEHCPVGLLDAQSGVLHSRGNITPTKRNQSNGVTGWGISSVPMEVRLELNQSGGASRFFKQVTSKEELDQYLQSMVRSK